MIDLTSLRVLPQNWDNRKSLRMINKIVGLATASAIAIPAGAAKAEDLRAEFERKYSATFTALGLSTDQMLDYPQMCRNLGLDAGRAVACEVAALDAAIERSRSEGAQLDAEASRLQAERDAARAVLAAMKRAAKGE